jgi:hypothetical protein
MDVISKDILSHFLVPWTLVDLETFFNLLFARMQLSHGPKNPVALITHSLAMDLVEPSPEVYEL